MLDIFALIVLLVLLAAAVAQHGPCIGMLPGRIARQRETIRKLTPSLFVVGGA